MIDKIIAFSVRNPILIGILVGILIIWGSFSLSNLPIDAVPDVTSNQVDIITNTPSLAPLEMEMFVTAPIEMAMSNIPGLIEMRSISKFGLSVVKVVFTDETDIYWARQQVFERLEAVSSEIPENAGKPYMGPASTGLGEVFQYIIRPKNPKDKSFSPMEIRTMQDWTIRRQLLGVRGIAEVSGFGGFKKEYQAKLNPERMKSLNVTIDELFDALRDGNSNTGGAYIEKQNKAFTIRGIGLASNLEEIGNTVVKMNDKIPVLVRDVADVDYGSSIRYGAITYNGEGETVGGIIMMMKGANGSEVITRIKAKMKEIEAKLPEGLIIEPFIDRSKLVNNAIKTVMTNLVEGALIVVLVILVFLGNWRASLLAASVIPLAMLFAFGWMKYFDVVGNIMSLGAIDFGLLVDPAIIVVESVVFFLAHAVAKQHSAGHKVDTFAARQEVVIEAAQEVKKSVVFGGLIILIVYFPILTLEGIEGKMFGPMAKTVGFAIFGALLLSVSYVPMMSALILRPPKDPHDHGISEKVVSWVYNKIVGPAVAFCLHRKFVAIGLAIFILIAGGYGFSKIGGEFIPKLQEGDLVIEVNLPVGTSMTEAINLGDKIQVRLMKEFPDEIERIVSKIGTSEVPVDPMPLEAQEIVVVLHDKKQWKKAKAQEDLSDLVSEVLKEFPGIVVSIQQPIENRVNELMSGARTDVVVKLFGYNLDTIVAKSNQIIEIIKTIDGAVDVQENKIFGLPQINIKYDRKQMAVYGVTVAQMNRAIQVAFAGASAGLIYENDKRFELTVRLASDDRAKIENIKNLLINTGTGARIPLRELADIQEKIGPSEIGHEDLKRKSNIGFNVRGRDLESIVNDLIVKVEANVTIPKGYEVEYGGEFENFRRAKSRLGIVVPIALFIIFCLLFASFGNIADSLLIYTVVPLSAVGGVFSLLLRDMNFSISAGVGFIALFGVAVLNGILLVEHFNQLGENGVKKPEDRVLKGLPDRFRPILMTSAVAALGFMPMALSTSVGAEVQKPLATVVIGGLLTTTILTLLVLPVLYCLFKKTKEEDEDDEQDIESLLHNQQEPVITNHYAEAPNNLLATLALLLVSVGVCFAQTKPISLQEAVTKAIEKNPQMRLADQKIQQQVLLKPTAYNLENPELIFEAPTGSVMRPGVMQRFQFPSVYTAQADAQEKRVGLAEAEKQISSNNLVYRVKVAYTNLQFVIEKVNWLRRQDSVYRDIIRVNDVRYRVGQITNLEKINGESQYKKILYNLRQAEVELRNTKLQFGLLLGSAADTTQTPSERLIKLPELPAAYRIDTTAFASNPILTFNYQVESLNKSLVKVEKRKRLPNLFVGFLNQGATNPSDIGYAPFQNRLRYGISVPLWLWTQNAFVRATAKEVEISQTQTRINTLQLNTEYTNALALYRQADENLNYFENVGLREASEILRDARESYRLGSITYYAYLQNLELAFQIEGNYLETLKNYNQSIIYIQYLKGER